MRVNRAGFEVSGRDSLHPVDGTSTLRPVLLEVPLTRLMGLMGLIVRANAMSGNRTRIKPYMASKPSHGLHLRSVRLAQKGNGRTEYFGEIVLPYPSRY